MNRHLAGLSHRAQQPRLTKEADVKTNAKTRKRMEGAVADRAKHGDTSSARVDHDPMRLTSFDDNSVEPPAFPVCRDDAPVNEGAQVRKPCLSPGEMRTTTTAGGLLLTHTASTTMRDIFPLPPRPRSLGGKSGREPTGQTPTSLPLPIGGRP